METRISIDAKTIRRYGDAEALAFMDQVLGAPGVWSPSLVEYRLSSDFQADWKLEVGCWLLLARDLGFLDALRVKLGRALGRAANPSGGGPNDKAHLVLNQELAPAMTIYYLTSLGWRFEAWEPPTVGGDVDVRLHSPDGRLVDIQAKAPDQPGQVIGGRRVDGEYDERVLAALDKALAQLRATPGPCRLVVISPQRTFSIDAAALMEGLIGRATYGSDGRWDVLEKDRGSFGDIPCAGVSGVADLHLIRGPDEVLYRCTVLLNPWCTAEASLPLAAFPYSRVLSYEQNEFVWKPERPSR